MQDKEAYIIKNITKINGTGFKLDKEGKELFPNETELKYYMRERFYIFIKTLSNENKIKKAFIENGYKKSSIEEMANQMIFLKSDLEGYLKIKIQNEVFENVDANLFVNEVSGLLEKLVADKNAFKYVRRNTERVLSKQFKFLSTIGFPVNIQKIKSGVMTANAGDSAQFLFLSRAILAGFNCSNVDVRSSRYDAVIDIDGKLIRVQVKGVSDSSISFKDRDRGGQGIDHRHERNRGKRITASDCDIYVAVDKEVGVCYIIPMAEYVDRLPESEILNVNLGTLTQFEENWSVISKFFS